MVRKISLSLSIIRMKLKKINETNSLSSAIGSLKYAQVCTRLDIAYAVSVLERFHGKHWKEVKKVMRYP